MTLLGFLVLLLLAAICGAIAEALVGFTAGGCLVSVGVGLIGAFVGRWIAARFGFPAVLVIGVQGAGVDVVWTIVGAIVFLIPMALIRSALRRT